MIKSILKSPCKIGVSKRTLRTTMTAVAMLASSMTTPVNKMAPIRLTAEEINNTLKVYYIKDFPTFKSWDRKTAIKFRNVIKQIIAEDKAAPKNENLDNIINTILKVADEYEMNPIDIACIIKRETHFVDKSKMVNCNNGKGLMQITSIVTDDMFQRPNVYHEKLPEFISQFKDSKELYKKLQTNNEINIRTGALSYHKRLQSAKGDIKKALENYNGSRNKISYGKDVYFNIKKYKEIFEHIDLF